jgi:hypothetical protein
MAENHKPLSWPRTAISILIPLLPILGVLLCYGFNPEFREYVNQTACEGFYSAKEDFEMLELIIVVFCGFVILVILYGAHIIKLKRICH